MIHEFLVGFWRSEKQAEILADKARLTTESLSLFWRARNTAHTQRTHLNKKG